MALLSTAKGEKKCEHPRTEGLGLRRLRGRSPSKAQVGNPRVGGHGDGLRPLCWDGLRPLCWDSVLEVPAKPKSWMALPTAPTPTTQGP